MQLLSVLAVLAVVAAVGGTLLAMAAVARATLWHFRAVPLHGGSAESWALRASVVAAVLGALWLAVGPFYSGFAGSATLSLAGTTSLAAGPRSSSLLAGNGLAVIPWLALAVLVALVPFGFRARATRPVAQSLCAVVLAAQGVIGISGYGLFFAPSAVLMLVAALLASRHHAE